jgi:hypothetical protein
MRATVLGSYVYVDGGEISQLDDSTGVLPEWDINPVNSTLSLDMTRSWTTLDVSFRSIPKPGPTTGKAVLWTDAASNQLYSWGGMWSHGLNMSRSQVWRFTADGTGGGTSSVESPANPAEFGELHAGEQSAFAEANGTAFSIGGLASGWTELNRLVTQAVPGTVTFDMRTKMFRNETGGPFNTVVGAAAQYIPSYGPNGLVMVLGGQAPVADRPYNLGDAPAFDLRNLTFFDPVTREAYWQMSTGDVPPSPRILFCTVGFQVPGGGGGYDM